MIISRRNFLGLILASGAAGTILTDDAVAKAIQSVPVDRITEVIRRGRELILAHKTQQWQRNDPVVTQMVNELFGFMAEAFPEQPHPDDVNAFFDGHLIPLNNPDILNHVDLGIVGEPLVPVAVTKCVIVGHRIPFDIYKTPNFVNIAKKIEPIIGRLPSPEYLAFEQKARELAPGAIWWTPRGVA